MDIVQDKSDPPQAKTDLSDIFGALADIAPVMIWVSGTDKKCIWVNKTRLQFTGRAMEKELGDGWAVSVHPDDLSRCLETYVAAFDQRKPFAMEYRLRRNDGEYRWVVDSGTPFSAGNQFRGYIGSCLDITDLKRAKNAAHKSEGIYRAIGESIDYGVWVCDAQGKNIYASPSFLKLVGMTQQQCSENGWTSLLPPDDVRETIAAWQHCVRTGESWYREHLFKGVDGQWHPVLARGVPVRDEQGNITQWAGINLDIRRIKEVENRERESRLEAERESRLKDEFLATLSHELRTPLNAILGWSQVLKRSSGDQKVIHEGIEVIDRNVRAQTQLIDDLLDMNRIVAGKIRLDVQSVQPASVIQSAVDAVRPAAEAKGIRLRTVIDPQAGPITADPNRLQQVIWNLLANAIKFTPKGGKVELLLERVNSQIEMTVNDTGEGISAEFLPHVFERFRQADSSMRRRHHGLGIGLSIAKNLVEMHGGTVRAASAGVGKGATFTVALPLRVIESQSETREHPHAARAKPTVTDFFEKPVLAGICVMVVDDETDARELVCRLLEDCQARVICAKSVAEAMANLHENPDVIVSDIGMPDTDGFEFLKAIRAKGLRTPAIALTAFARGEDRLRALHAGYQMHLSKPVEPAELIATIASLAGRLTAQGLTGIEKTNSPS